MVSNMNGVLGLWLYKRMRILECKLCLVDWVVKYFGLGEFEVDVVVLVGFIWGVFILWVFGVFNWNVGWIGV